MLKSHYRKLGENMSNVIDLLERLGAQPAHVDPAAAVTGRDPKQLEALLAGDSTALAALIGVQALLFCSITAPESEPDEPADEPAEPADEPCDEPTDAPDESGSRAA